MTGPLFYPCFRCGREAVAMRESRRTLRQWLRGRPASWRFVCPLHLHSA